MTRAVDALELMHSADHRWRSIRAEGIEWVDDDAQSEAIRAVMALRSGAERVSSSAEITAVFESTDDDAGELKTARRKTSRWHAWHRQPADSRYDVDHPGFPLMSQVRRGATWWNTFGDEPTKSNFGDEGHGSGPPTKAALLLSPAVLLPHLEFRYLRKARLIGRPALLLSATPIPGNKAGLEPLAIGLVGDSVRLAVDEESGIVLRLDLQYQGSRFLRVEIKRIEFDRDIADEVFEPRQPIIDVREGSRHLGLSNLPTYVTHPVFVTSGLEFDPTQLHGLYFPGPWVTVGGPAVWITYPIVHRGRAGTLSIQQSLEPFVSDDNKDWREVGEARTRSGGAGSQVRLTKSSVNIHLESDVHSTDELVAVASSLQRLPAEPPPLVAVR